MPVLQNPHPDDASDAGGAGDVALVLLRMQQRIRGESNTQSFRKLP